MKDRLRIAVLGKGNVGSHLAKALEAKADVTLISSRGDIDLPEDTNVCLISVKDDAIAEVVSKLNGFRGVVAHTSGSVPMSVLEPAGCSHGVFYPLQTFSKGVALDYASIPIFIEASDEHAQRALEGVADTMGAGWHPADSTRRRKLHLASVFACNFTNRLYAISDKLLEEEGTGIGVLMPLIGETVRKLGETLDPEASQTGPASRGDSEVVRRHLDMLSSSPQAAEIYRLLSADIYRASGHGEPDFQTDNDIQK